MPVISCGGTNYVHVGEWTYFQSFLEFPDYVLLLNFLVNYELLGLPFVLKNLSFPLEGLVLSLRSLLAVTLSPVFVPFVELQLFAGL